MRTTISALDPNPACGSSDGHLVITLTGEESSSARPKVAVIPVVDTSGSMASGGKLSVVVAALRHLSGYLSAEDHLALVEFEQTAATRLPATAAGKSGRDAFDAALSSLRPHGSTNLAGGLTLALAAASEVAPDVLVRLVVLTDGQANVGVRDRDGLAALLDDLPANVSVSFLGVGTDCDHDLLGHLAAAGRGNYGFVESADRSADVLGAEIGGLLEIEAHHVRVQLTPAGKSARFAPALNASSRREDDGTLDVEVGNLLAGQTRHVVIPLALRGPARPHARPVTIAVATVSAVLDEQPHESIHRPKVHFGAPDAGIDPDLQEVVELAVLAAAQRTAEQAAARHDYAGARFALDRLAFTSGAAAGLQASMSGLYGSAGAYAGSSVMRSSSSHLLAGSLTSSGVEFDALAARTTGGYTTPGQRDVAAATANAVRDRSPSAAPAGGPGPAAGGLQLSWAGLLPLTPPLTPSSEAAKGCPAPPTPQLCGRCTGSGSYGPSGGRCRPCRGVGWVLPPRP